MNFSAILLEFLKNQGVASIPGFGSFYLHQMTATLDSEEKNILPPSQEIAFKPEQTDSAEKFIQFIALKKNIPLIDAELELKKHVNFWNATLFKNKKVEIEGLGTFYLEDRELLFKGKKTENLSPDFYGLEEINLSEIKNSSKGSIPSYQSSRSIYWAIPLLLIIGALTYFGWTQPELIFGKKSFPAVIPEKKIVKSTTDSLKTDTLRTHVIVQDSLQKDSIKNAALPVVAAKKWTSKKSHTKSKWKKPRKR